MTEFFWRCISVVAALVGNAFERIAVLVVLKPLSHCGAGVDSGAGRADVS